MKSFLKNACITLAAVFAFSFAGISADASISSQYQVEQSKSTITVKWDYSFKNTTTFAYSDKINLYLVEYGSGSYITDSTPVYTSIPSSSTSYKFENLKAGTAYSFRATIDRLYNNGSTYTETVCSGTIGTAPGMVTGVNISKWWKYLLNVDVIWDKQTASDGYEYIMQYSNGKAFKKGTVTSNNTSFNKIKNENTYKIKVRAFSTINGKKYYGNWSGMVGLLTQPTVKSAKIDAKKGTLTLSWNKINGAKSYDVYVGTSKKIKSFKKVASNIKASKNSTVIKKFNKKKFSAKKTYYFYIAAKMKVGKNISDSGANYVYCIKNNSLQSESYISN